MAAIPVLMSVDEYLATTYRPDCDYIDGEVLERNMGEKPHARLQTFFAFFFRSHEDEWQIEVLTEQRVQINARRFRIPDVALVPLSDSDPRVVRTPPLLCIEILASDDRMSSIRERLRDYAAMGVQAMWVVDPWRRTAFFAGPDAITHEVAETLTVPDTSIRITTDEIFAELDRLQQRATQSSS